MIWNPDACEILVTHRGMRATAVIAENILKDTRMVHKSLSYNKYFQHLSTDKIRRWVGTQREMEMPNAPV